MRLYSYGAVGRFPGEIVLDPFVGTGTTCAVAKRMGRRFIGIDLDAAYIRIARERVRNAPAAHPCCWLADPNIRAGQTVLSLRVPRPAPVESWRKPSTNEKPTGAEPP